MNLLTEKLIFKGLEKTNGGQVKLLFPNRAPLVFGEGPLVSELSFQDEKVLGKILSKGDIGLAETIIEGQLKISNTSEFIRWACQNDDRLRQAFHGNFLGTLTARIRGFFQENTPRGSRRNIMAHYDLGNDFYSRWLDPSMTYSSAIFEGDKDLIQAQNRKYDRIIQELNIKASDHVLEIGCGWGGFFSRAVEKTGCRVTAVMNSPAQARYNQELIARKGLHNQVNLQLKDYRQIEGKYDKVVSIEMIEAVGPQYWSTYFAKISSALSAGGQALIQAITMKEDRFEDYLKNPDFINQYIFPGGKLLSHSTIRQNALQNSLRSFAPFEFGLSYAETLRQWSERFTKACESSDMPLPGPDFQRLWNFYLNYCEGAFRAGRINVGHYLMEKV